MTLDENKYSDPQAFIPERFLPRPLGRGETLSDNVIFGWGRRYASIEAFNVHKNARN